ncbi:hypothetical protein [Nocardia arthritidis]|uniref:Uncharacterized protein n=1 Tax=Nocardia arthritidis TaxID=228602 RepID=A0A6G9Y9M0_9NOCA|nr:hypothetical protein [Nocardia arthritidis]QIS09820.1 hypothetical protein F5544_09600 [Nocardia arthritidis]
MPQRGDHYYRNSGWRKRGEQPRELGLRLDDNHINQLDVAFRIVGPLCDLIGKHPGLQRPAPIRTHHAEDPFGHHNTPPAEPNSVPSCTAATV